MDEDMLSHMQERLQRLEDLEAIRLLKATYCLHADIWNRDPERGRKLGALFTPDGLWDVGYELCVGPDRIAESLMSLPEAWALKLSVHFVMNPRLSVDGDTGEGEWSFLVPAVSQGASEPQWFAGIYAEKYVRTDAGWRFSEMRARPIMAPGADG